MSETRKFATFTIGDLLAILAMLLSVAGVYLHDREAATHLTDRADDTDKRITRVETRIDSQDVTLRKVDVMANDISWIRREISTRKPAN